MSGFFGFKEESEVMSAADTKARPMISYVRRKPSKLQGQRLNCLKTAKAPCAHMVYT